MFIPFFFNDNTKNLSNILNSRMSKNLKTTEAMYRTNIKLINRQLFINGLKLLKYWHPRDLTLNCRGVDKSVIFLDYFRIIKILQNIQICCIEYTIIISKYTIYLCILIVYFFFKFSKNNHTRDIQKSYKNICTLLLPSISYVCLKSLQMLFLIVSINKVIQSNTTLFLLTTVSLPSKRIYCYLSIYKIDWSIFFLLTILRCTEQFVVNKQKWIDLSNIYIISWICCNKCKWSYHFFFNVLNWYTVKDCSFMLR